MGTARFGVLAFTGMPLIMELAILVSTWTSSTGMQDAVLATASRKQRMKQSRKHMACERVDRRALIEDRKVRREIRKRRGEKTGEIIIPSYAPS
jgi:hypothetical protein